MLDLSRILKNLTIPFVGVSLIGLTIYIRFFHYSIHEILGNEDGVYEYIQFFVLLISSILLLRLYLINSKTNDSFSKYFFVFLAFIFFMVSMEEISWGQRLLGFKTPEHLNMVNAQNEINIHNISFIHVTIRYAYIGIFAWSLSGWLIKFLFSRIKNNSKIQCKTDIAKKFLILPTHLIIYFLPIFINALPFENFAPQDFELAETFMCLGFFIHVYNFYTYCMRKSVQTS